MELGLLEALRARPRRLPEPEADAEGELLLVPRVHTGTAAPRGVALSQSRSKRLPKLARPEPWMTEVRNAVVTAVDAVNCVKLVRLGLTNTRRADLLTAEGAVIMASSSECMFCGMIPSSYVWLFAGRNRRSRRIPLIDEAFSRRP